MIDQTTDLNGKLLHRVVGLYSPPDFVKRASQEDLSGTENLEVHLCAHPAGRMFPCHTPASTWMSYAMLREQPATKEAEAIASRIKQFAKFHAIEDLLPAIDKVAADSQASPSDELPDTAYGWIFERADGTKEKRYPLRNAKEVRACAEFLVRRRRDLPWEVRHTMATRVFEKAAEFGAILGETQEVLERVAGRGACTAKTAAETIIAHVKASRKGPGAYSDIQYEMAKTAKVIAEHPAQLRQPEALIKLAASLDAFDRQHGLDREYTDEFPAPEDVLFALTKTAMVQALRDHVETTTGNVYRLEDLERIKIGSIRDALGDSYADALCSGLKVDCEKAAEIIPTMPRPDAQLFDLLMTEVGVASFGKTAASEVVGKMSDELISKLADERKTIRGAVPKVPQPLRRADSLFSKFK